MLTPGILHKFRRFLCSFMKSYDLRAPALGGCVAHLIALGVTFFVLRQVGQTNCSRTNKKERRFSQSDLFTARLAMLPIINIYEIEGN